MAAPSDDGGELPPFLMEKHRKYVVALQSKTDSFEYVVTEFLRMSGVYWGLCTMHLLSAGDEMDSKFIADWVMKCQHESVGPRARSVLVCPVLSSPHERHPPHHKSCRCSILLLRHLHRCQIPARGRP
jgi:hypothetical protein